MSFFSAHILSIVAYLPLAGALVLVFAVPKEKTKAIQIIATAVAAIDFFISLPLWFWFDRAKDGYQFEEVARWIPALGVRYHFGIDGISLLLILLTTLLGVISVYSSYSAIHERQKEYYVFLLLLQTGMLGTFMALDFFLFYFFWEVMLVPMYFLIGIWGGARRLYAAIKFFLYTLAGSVVMLLGIIVIYFYNTTGVMGLPGLNRAPTFDIPTLTALTPGMPAHLQILLFFAFFFALRDQGADVPVPHLASGRARRGADRRLGHPRRRPAEDGDLRISCSSPADVSEGGRHALGDRVDAHDCRSSASSTARWCRSSRRT